MPVLALHAAAQVAEPSPLLLGAIMFALLMGVIALMGLVNFLARRFAGAGEEGPPEPAPAFAAPLSYERPAPRRASAAPALWSPPTSTPPLPAVPPLAAPPAVVAPRSPAVRRITVPELAAAQNVLVVGNKGSGKTTLLQAIIGQCRESMLVFDPHEEPAKWPAHSQIIGGGRAFTEIYHGLFATERLMDARSKRAKSGDKAFTPIRLVGDEWGSVTKVCDLFFKGNKVLKAGELLGMLLKEGRKFKISFVGAAHGDTADSLGSKGDTEAFELNFDWIVYMGGFAVERIAKHAPEEMPRLRYGRTPEGGTFPLTVIAWWPAGREWRLLSLEGLPGLQPAQGLPATDLRAMLAAEQVALPEQPEPDGGPAAQEKQLTPLHLKTAYLIAQAQPLVQELIAAGKSPQLAVQKVLSDRKLAAALWPEKVAAGQKTLGGQAAQDAGKLRREVEDLLGIGLGRADVVHLATLLAEEFAQ